MYQIESVGMIQSSTTIIMEILCTALSSLSLSTYHIIHITYTSLFPSAYHIIHTIMEIYAFQSIVIFLNTCNLHQDRIYTWLPHLYFHLICQSCACQYEP